MRRTYMQASSKMILQEEAHRFNGIYDPGINWYEELQARIEREEQVNYTDGELRVHAGDWVTCACGNLCEILPRDSNGAPLDYKLMVLGMRFNDQIEESSWWGAMETLHKIESRSAHLITEITVGYQPLASSPMILL